jgi:hypothetical protein
MDTGISLKPQIKNPPQSKWLKRGPGKLFASIYLTAFTGFFFDRRLQITLNYLTGYREAVCNERNQYSSCCYPALRELQSVGVRISANSN